MAPRPGRSAQTSRLLAGPRWSLLLLPVLGPARGRLADPDSRDTAGDARFQMFRAPGEKVPGEVLGGRLDIQDLVEMAVVDVLGEIPPERREIAEVRHETRRGKLPGGQLDLNGVGVTVQPGTLMASRQAGQYVRGVEGEPLPDPVHRGHAAS